MALYLAFIDCDRDENNGDKPYVVGQYPLLGGYYNKVGGANSPTVFGIYTEDAATVAAIEADPNVMIFGDGQFFEPSAVTNETHWQSVLEAWYNGEEI